MSKLPVSVCAYRHASDIDVNARFDANEWQGLLNVCIVRATRALENPSAGYSDLQRHHLADVFRSMAATHRTIRKLLGESGPDQPEGVDALPLARLQLEGFYTVCLMLEDSHWVDVYLQDHWRKQFIQFLLTREETSTLPRWREFALKSPFWLTQLRDHLGITQDQQLTIEHEELGTPLPSGFVKQPIPFFPTPGSSLRKITNPEKRRMVQRLYPHYVHLCSFAHGLPKANFYKMMFDKRSFHRTLISDEKVGERFQRLVVSEAFITSFFSIVQSTAELTFLYPTNVDLPSAAMKAWNPLLKAHLLTKAIWAIRTEKLLGVIG
jgi:hypothetical protein